MIFELCMHGLIISAATGSKMCPRFVDSREILKSKANVVISHESNIYSI